MSDILFLGTGAADWDVSRKDSFFRRNSSALLDGKLLIDCGAHIFDFAEYSGEPRLFDGVTDIVITHRHSDHFSADSVLRIADSHPIRLGCDAHIRSIVGEHKNIEYTVFVPYKEEVLGNFRVLPLLANHDVVLSGDSAAFHYIVTAPDGKKLFYGLDGAWFLRPSWEEMKRHRFDIMVLDCTVGDFDDWRIFEHNTIPMLRMMVGEIRRNGLLADGGKLVASHLAQTLHPSHEETSEILSALDMITASDGMKLVL